MTPMTPIETLAHWEIALATTLVVMGSVFLILALGSVPRIWRIPPGPVQNIRRMRAFVRSFRCLVLAAGTGGVGLGWLLDEPTLYGLAVLFCLEELWECFFLRHALADMERILLEGSAA